LTIYGDHRSISNLSIAVAPLANFADRQGECGNHARRVVQMENNPPPSMASVEGFPHDAALTGSRYAETARGEPRQLAQSFIIPARTGIPADGREDRSCVVRRGTAGRRYDCVQSARSKRKVLVRTHASNMFSSRRASIPKPSRALLPTSLRRHGKAHGYQEMVILAFSTNPALRT
jgi:hypothetical protein